MNDMTTGTALALPEPAALAALFRADDGVDPLIARIEAEVRAYVPDTSTKKGRDAIASLAYKVSRSKTALDDAGKSLTESAKREIALVDAARKKIRDRLDALRDEARAPLDHWEEAEAARKAKVEAQLDAFRHHGMDAGSTSAEIEAKIAEIIATVIGDEFGDQREQAEMVRETALAALRALYAAAKTREDQAAELEALRAEKAAREAREAAERAEQERIEAEAEAKRQEKARIAREVEERAAKLRIRAENAKAYIAALAEGYIGAAKMPFGILLFELEEKLPPLIDELGEHAPALHEQRIAAISKLQADAKAAQEAQAKADEEARIAAEKQAEADRAAAAEKARVEAEQKAARETAEAEERHRQEIEAAKRREEEAVQRERDRIEAERKAEADARAKREADAAHRAKIKADIATALALMAGEASPDQIAEALMAGKIPHCEVKL